MGSVHVASRALVAPEPNLRPIASTRWGRLGRSIAHSANPLGWASGLRLLGITLLFWVALGVMVMPTAGGSFATVGTPTVHTPLAVHILPFPMTHGAARTFTHASPSSATARSIPGSDPTGQLPINGEALGVKFAEQQLQLQKDKIAHAKAVALATPAAPVHNAISISTGSFSGYVNATGGLGIPGVTLQAYSTGGALCPATTCGPVTTNSAGYFTNLVCPTGADYVQTELTTGWLNNLTYATCFQNVDTYLGTIFLVHLAYVRGTVKGDDPAHENVTGVQVVGCSRDLTVCASPTGSTDNGGHFIAAVPPLPSRVDFTPASPGYAANFTFVNATPWENVSLGIIYLERGTLVRAELYNSVTQSPIGSMASLTVCSRVTGNCGQQGTIGGTNVQAYGPPGTDYVQAEALGYILDTHSIAFVPKEAPGHVFDAGRIYLVPLGGFVLNVSLGITHNAAIHYPWNTGLYYVTVNPLDGYSMVSLRINPVTGAINTTTASSNIIVGCGAPGRDTGRLAGVFGSVPLRADILIKPDTIGICGLGPQWPIPGDAPVWDNETVLNITPNEQTGTSKLGIWLNFTTGVYAEGNISDPNIPAGLREYTAFGISQPNPTQDQYSYVWAGAGSAATSPWMCSGGDRTIPAPSGTFGHTFCVPMAPGPEIIQVGATGYLNNFTWVSSAQLCCNFSQLPARLGSINNEHVNTINLSTGGNVYGKVFQNNTSLGVAFGSFKICTAGSNVQLFCSSGAINLDGTFFSTAPYGWDAVTASASGFSPNTAWVYVNGNDSVGNITLTRLGTIYGNVTDQFGSPVREATIQACPLTTNACSNVAGGLTTTSGGYNGTLAAGWLPWSTYRIEATASGYTTNWTWVNVTAGTYEHVPTIQLIGLGVNNSPLSRGGFGPVQVAPSGVWIDGWVIDNQTGWGMVPGSVTAVPNNGGNAVGFGNGTNTGGYFNGSVPSGIYNISISSPDYYTLNVPFNASGRSFVHLGNLNMIPYAWVAGTVRMNPWPNTVILSGGRFVNITLVPGGIAGACDRTGFLCGSSTTVDSLGFYNGSVPYGGAAHVTVTGTFTGNGPSAVGGFNQNHTVFNATNWTNDITQLTPVYVDLFGGITGRVWDNSTINTSTMLPTLSARWETVSAITTGNNNGAANVVGGGGGQYTILLPSGNRANNTLMSASLPGYYYSRGYTVPQVIQPGEIVTIPDLGLMRWGWVESQVNDASTHRPIPFIGVSALYNDLLNQTSYSATHITNGGGFVNLTAPVGAKVLVTVGPGIDYNSSNVTVRVNHTETTYANVSGPNGIGNISVDAWGWAMSAMVNSSIVPTLTTVIDKVNGLPIPFAQVMACSTDQNVGCGSPASTSWSGQFVTDAPIGPKDLLQVTHLGFLANKSLMSVHPGQTVVYPTINLTGDAVVAGRVVSNPSGLPVSGASVQVCPHGQNSSVCSTVATNAIGEFWAIAPPVLVDIQATAQGFVGNTTLANPCSDCWQWIGDVRVDEYAYVSGIVRGLPSGLPVFNATVSACSTLGFPVGACGFSITTELSGHFLLPVPANTYILQTSDNFYNTSYLPLSLSPGEHVNVGTVFLSQFGWLVGTVYSGATFSPVSGAIAYICPDWSGGTCSTPTKTDSGGHFTTSGPPGPYVVTISAPGYSDSYVPGKILSGVTTTLPSILVYPLGTDQSYLVSGRVVNASDPTQGVAGALVAVLSNGTPSNSVPADANGGFRLSVLYGTYTLSIGSPGYRPSQTPLLVQGPVSGLIIQLSVMTFNVSGSVTDSLTHQALSGVEIALDGNSLAVTDVNGAYIVALPNGSATLTAIYQGGGPVGYPPVTFIVQVNGVSLTHDVTMFPPTTTVYGLVVDRATGLALSGATVVITGKSIEGIPINQTMTSDVTGQFTVSLPQGTYSTIGTYGGYLGVASSFEANQTQKQLTVELAPIGSSSSSVVPSGSSAFLGLGVIVVATGAAVLVAALLLRRPASKAPARRTRGPATPGSGTGAARPAAPPSGGTK